METIREEGLTEEDRKTLDEKVNIRNIRALYFNHSSRLPKSTELMLSFREIYAKLRLSKLIKKASIEEHAFSNKKLTGVLCRFSKAARSKNIVFINTKQQGRWLWGFTEDESVIEEYNNRAQKKKKVYKERAESIKMLLNKLIKRIEEGKD